MANPKFIVPGKIETMPKSMIDEFRNATNLKTTSLGLILSQCDLMDDGSYIRYSRLNVNFERWRFLLQDLNSVHPSYIVDYTATFYQSGREQSIEVLELLLNGSFQFVNNGSVIFNRNNGKYFIVFIAETDSRIYPIEKMRYNIQVAKYKNIQIEYPYADFKVQPK